MPAAPVTSLASPITTAAVRPTAATVPRRAAERIDVHQHLWPAQLIEGLRRRTEAPMLRGWTLITAGEAPYQVDPADHDLSRRSRLDGDCARVLLSMSTPLGVESLPPAQAQPLLDAWRDGVRELPEPFAGWAAVSEIDPDLGALSQDLASDTFVGLQISATLLADPAGVERMAAVLRCCERQNKPVLVHPGPVGSTSGRRGGSPEPRTPSWWPAVVDYPAQLQAAWWAWQVAGPSLLPDLRVCFVAGAGLAAIHHERFEARSGCSAVLQQNVYVDTSSYGRQGIDALVRALGLDPIVLGSDRPYAGPTDPQLGEAAWHAISVTNPARLLKGIR
jgi:predicted TIM-barrel fold metal-dependent hydrolase